MTWDVSQLFEQGLAAGPNADLIVTKDGTRLTYGDADEWIEPLAAALAKREATGTDRHWAVFCPNLPEAYLCILSIFRADGCWLPVNIRNGAEQNGSNLHRSDCSILFFHSSLEADVKTIRKLAPNIKLFVCIDGENELGISLKQFIEDAKPFMPAPKPDTDADKQIALLATGGTTGESKFAIWNNRVCEGFARAFPGNMPFEGRPSYLLAAPMTHAAGVLSLPVLPQGAKIVIHEGVDTEAILDAIEEHRITHLFLPPTAIYRMLDSPGVRERDFSSLRYFICSSAPMSAQRIKEGIEVFGPVLAQCYGQSEVPLLITYMSPEQHIEAIEGGHGHRFESCGMPTPDVEVMIADENGETVETNVPGEILVRGQIVCPGYYGGKSEIDEKGWHHTGDIAKMDEDGYVYIVDRKKDMILTGGFNVYSNEVEHVIAAHPEVAQCAVIGIPDEDWGEAVTAFIVPRPGTDPDPQSVISYCRNLIGGVKTPKKVFIRDALPLSPVGKVLKRELRSEFWGESGRQV